MMKNLLFILTLFIFGLNSLSAQDSLVVEDKEWTLLLYVIGTDIVQDAITDLGEIKAAGNTENMNIVGLIGGATIPGWEKPATSVFVNGEEIPHSFLPSDTTMVSTKNISEFIDWGVTNYPADKYMIAFYNHGMATRGFGHENVTDTEFSINDLKTGIGNSSFCTNGNKFELLAFDACLMALVETQSVLQNFGKYYIASEEEEPWHAWNWTPVIQAMNNQTGLDGHQLGKIIIDNFIQHAADNNSHGVTLSVTDLSRIDALEKSIEAVYTSLDDDIYLANFIRARGKSEEYAKSVNDPAYSEDVVDIGDLFTHLKALEPTLTTEIDQLLSDLDAAVLYERSDAARPRASGMAIYVPYNQFQDSSSLRFFTNNYHTIGHSSVIKNFIKNDYIPFVINDDNPISATVDHSLGLIGGTAGQLGMNFTGIKLAHADDLDHIQIILLEEIDGDPDEYIVLGSTHHDTVVTNGDGSVIFGHEWDEEWLALGDGHPVYISDIQDFEVHDENGNLVEKYTRLLKPAIYNPGTDNERNVILNYRTDMNNNYHLEGIEGEPYLVKNTLVPSKERFQLVPGDEIQMIYEIFDTRTHEGYFVPNPNHLVTIENGNSDLDLFHHRLEDGNYHIGFVLMDHAQNDTVIIDPVVRTVKATNTTEVEISEDVVVFPNPFIDRINVTERNLESTYTLTTILGVEVYKGNEIWTKNFSNLLPGSYFLTIENKDNTIRTIPIIKE